MTRFGVINIQYFLVYFTLKTNYYLFIWTNSLKKSIIMAHLLVNLFATLLLFGRKLIPLQSCCLYLPECGTQTHLCRWRLKGIVVQNKKLKMPEISEGGRDLGDAVAGEVQDGERQVSQAWWGAQGQPEALLCGQLTAIEGHSSMRQRNTIIHSSDAFQRDAQ